MYFTDFKDEEIASQAIMAIGILYYTRFISSMTVCWKHAVTQLSHYLLLCCFCMAVADYGK